MLILNDRAGESHPSEHKCIYPFELQQVKWITICVVMDDIIPSMKTKTGREDRELGGILGKECQMWLLW